jgi:outer membrane protein
MAPLIMKYAQENGYTMIIDTSKPWPQSPVLWWNVASIDITKNVIDAYNVQSGVPAPTAPSSAPKPATRAPGAGTTPKPTTPKPSEAPKQ